MKLKITATPRDKLARRARKDPLLDMEPEQIEAWVNANVNSFPQVKAIVGRLSMMVALLMRDRR